MPITTYLSSPLAEGETVSLSFRTILLDDERSVGVAEYPGEPGEPKSYVVDLTNGENVLRFRISAEALEALFIIVNELSPTPSGFAVLIQTLLKAMGKCDEVLCNDSGGSRSSSDSP